MATTANDMTVVREHGVGWGLTLAVLALVLALFTGLFYSTVQPMVSIWIESDTYAHGFAILPISLWLVWEKRAALVQAVPSPTLVPLAVMIPVGALWLIAHLVDVAVVQQYAFVCLLILVVWAMVGTPVARYLAFPLGFLLLAVPVGGGLMYPMMEFTADFTVGALRLTGIPVYRDGTFFSIPSGDWSVVEACSGIRYLLAAVTLGVLYAYLSYTKLWKRLVFIGFSIIVPVLANGVRAYLIVMIAHLSDMKLATGIDHFVYGWVFFGIVVTVMFAVGAIWRDPLPGEERIPGGATPRGRAPVLVAALLAAMGAVWAGLGFAVDRPLPQGDAPLVLSAPAGLGDWRLEGEAGDGAGWHPEVLTPDASSMLVYRSPRGRVSLYLGVYRYQRDGAEAVNVQNQMALQEGSDWSDKEISLRSVELPGGAILASQHRLASRGGERLLVWTWYRIGGFHTAKPVSAKLAELGYRLIGGRRDAALIAVAAPYADEPETAARLLQDFLSAVGPAIDTEIDRAVAPAP